LRFLVRLVPNEPTRDVFLGSIRALARTVGAEARNPKWTSYGALEIDVFCPSRADLDLFTAATEPLARLEFVTDLNIAPEHTTEDEAFSRARALFNAERYWECHEILEGLWRQKNGPEKSFLQGVILVCAAFVHHQKGEEGVALSVLKRGAQQLDLPGTVYGGFDIPSLKAQVKQMLALQKFTGFRV
jgi:uncharacterized protein